VTGHHPRERRPAILSFWDNPDTIGPEINYRHSVSLALAANLYTGLGFNGKGVAMATLMGKLLAACIEHDKNETAFPLSDLKPLPLHAVRKPIVQSVVYWKQLMDRLNP